MPKEHARIWQCVSGSSAAAQLPRTLIYPICLTIPIQKNEHLPYLLAQACLPCVIDRISSGMKEEIRRARELGIPILNRQTQLSDGSSDPVIVGRYINGISLNGLEYLKNDADEVIYFAGVEAAKVYLREHGVTEDEMEDMVFRKSVGTCFRCGDPLFLSDIPEYTCQCFRCDEDFYSIEQDVDL